MSSASERRVWLGRAKVAATVCLTAVVVLAALRFLPEIETTPNLLTKAGESLPVSIVEVQTDGVLERDYILRMLDLPDDANLLSVDLDGLKQSVEAIGQVRSAIVTRRFPDALVVTIRERRPILRISAQRANGDKLKLFVDEEGEVFQADPHLSGDYDSLPFLDGVTLFKSDEGFSRIDNIGPLAKLLSEARAIAPHLYQRWQVVSLEREDRVIARGQLANQILFDSHADFRTQLGKLDYIIDYYRSSRPGKIDSVDLTLGDQVPVKFL